MTRSSVANPAIARPAGQPRSAPRSDTAYWAMAAKVVGLFGVTMIYFPILWLMLLSLSSRPLSGVPYPLTLEHYTSLFVNGQWMGPLGASVLISLVVGISCMVIATVMARSITRSGRPLPIMGLSLLPLFVPGLTMGSALFIFFRTALHLELGFWSIYLAQLIWALPFSLLLVIVVASRFNLTLLDAAQDLGASPWQTFWHIEFPILLPGIVGAGLFGFLLSFSELPRSLFVRGLSTTLPIYNWAMAASQQSNVPIIFSLTTLTVLLTLPLVGVLFWIMFVRLDSSK